MVAGDTVGHVGYGLVLGLWDEGTWIDLWVYAGDADGHNDGLCFVFVVWHDHAMSLTFSHSSIVIRYLCALVQGTYVGF